ncbi:MAG: hypothetical protein ACREIB_05605, partial [Pseudomonadota bacterium]
MRRSISIILSTVATLVWLGQAGAAPASKKTPAKPSATVETVRRYVDAMAAGDKVAAAKLDFACAYRLTAAASNSTTPFPPDGDPLYNACWEPIARAHAAGISQTDQGVNSLWPGKGSLVFFGDHLASYAPSLFVMEALGASPPAGGLVVDLLDSRPIPPASFRIQETGPLVTAPAVVVRLSVGYRDPLLSPVAHAPGASKWTNTTKRPRQAMKSVTLRWIVLSDLKKLGFPNDTAVLNLPVKDASPTTQAVPFTAEPGGYEPDSARWWQPDDAPGVLLAGIGRAALFPDMRDRIGMLNRVLLIDPSQPEALALLTRDLYQFILRIAVTTHNVPVNNATLLVVFNELYWNTYAQTTRWDLSLGME